MAQVKSFNVLLLTENDSTKFVWKHLWNTSQKKIEKALHGKNISISTEYPSGTLVATVPTPLDKQYILIGKVFKELSSQMKAVKRKVDHKITDEEINLLSNQLTELKIGVFVDQERIWVWFVGSAIIIDNIHIYLEGIDCKFLQEDPEQKQKTVETESLLDDSFEHVSVPMVLSQEDQAIILLHDLLKWEWLTSPNVIVECQRFDIKILVIDPKEKDEIEKKIKEKIDYFRQMLACKIFNFNPLTLEFISRPAVHEYILSRVNMKHKGFSVVWFREEGNVLKLYTSDVGMVNYRSNSFKDCFKEESFPVPSVVFKRSENTKKLEQLGTNYKGNVCIELSSTATTVNVLYISGCSDVVGRIKAMYDVTPVVLYKDIQWKCKRFYTKMKQLIEIEYDVELREDDSYGDYGWVLTGEHAKTRLAREQLSKLRMDITSETKTCITDENKDFFLEKILSIQEKSRCLIQIKDVSPAVISKTCNIDIRDKVQCRTWTLQCGTIVKLNNCNMRHLLWMMKGSLVVDISDDEENFPKVSIRHLKEFSVATIYLPKWQDNTNQERNVLCRQLNTLMKEMAVNPNLVALNFDLADIDRAKWPVKKYIKAILAVVNTIKPNFTVQFNENQKEKYYPITQIIDDVNRGSKINSDGKKTGLKITIIKGELAKQKTDVIVNSAHKTLQLSNGAVSSSILKYAGQGIQDDCNSQLRRQNKAEIACTDVVMTEAFNLGCKVVFHGTLPTFVQDTQILETFVRNCLMKAESHQCKSISFPALGTGNLRYPPELVAEKMFDAVEKFAKEMVPKKLLEVFFVIYFKDEVAIKAFEREEEKRCRPDGTWIETTNVSPECITCKISVVGENSRIVDDTFKEVIENISQRKRENITFSSCQSVESHDIPLDQTIDRRANISSTEQTDNSNPQVQDKDSNGQEKKKIPTDSIHMSHNTFAPDEDLPRLTDKTESEECTVEITMIQDDVEDPCKEILDMMNRSNIKVEKIVWNELNCKQARVKLSSETDADHLINRLSDKRRYKSTKCSPDAVVNIRAKISQSMRKFLQMEQIRYRLIKYSGVDIDDDNDEVVLRGDLTEISTARDLLLRWKEEGSSQTGTENQITKSSQPPLALENLGYMEGDPLNISNVRRSNDKNQMAVKTEIKDKVPDKEKIIRKSDFKRPLNRNGDYTDEKDSNERSLHNQSLNNANLDGKTRNPEVDNPSSNVPGSQPSGETTGAIPKRKQIENSGGGDKYEFPSFAAEKQHTYEDFQRPNTAKLESVEKNNRNNGKVTNKDPWEKKVMVPLAIPQDDSLMLITKEGIKVFVYKAHICHIANVDCIVNSTSSDMTHKHGLSCVIAKEAGKRMEEECKRFISTFGALGRSDVCVTTAGNLSHYKKILHINAPKMKDDMNISDFSDDLSVTVRMCLAEASKQKLKSVALPAISSGFGGAPKDHHFLAYPNGVLDFSGMEGKKSSIKEIHFVDVTDEMVDYIQAVFLHNHPDVHKNLKDKIKKMSDKAKDFYKALKPEPAGKHSEFFFFKLAVITCDGGLLSTWKHPHIKTIQQCDGFGVWNDNETAVVITEDIEMSGSSTSSKKCKERGGRAFKKAYDGLKKEKKNPGSVLGIFGDDNLKFGLALVTIMPTMNDKTMKKSSNEQAVFFKLIKNCCKNILLSAEESNVKHLSMPVLGADCYQCNATWFLKSCVSCIVAEVNNFQETRTGKQCMVVHIVTNGNTKLNQLLETKEWMQSTSSRV